MAVFYVPGEGILRYAELGGDAANSRAFHDERSIDLFPRFVRAYGALCHRSNL
jgi:hypothetical protein